MGMVTHTPVAANGGRRRVLIIDDDPVVRLVYMNNFKAAGFEVESAPDGPSAWTKLQKRCPDAILLDLILPKGGGVELLKKMRAQEAGPLAQVPVYVFTNAFLSEMSEEAARSGANQIFDKAVTSPAGIVAAIRKGFGLENEIAASAPPLAGSPGGTDVEQSNTNSAAVQYFVFQMPQKIAAARKELQEFLQAPEAEARLAHLQNLYHKVHAMTGSTASAGLNLVAQQCATLEALLKELQENPTHLNASTRRTVSQAVEVLGLMFERASEAEKRCQARPFQVLVVNDDQICRQAMSRALERVRFSVTHVGDIPAARQCLGEAVADLIILDLNKPEAGRTEISQSLHALPNAAATPTIFVTNSLKDFEGNEPSLPSGPDDLIAKPFIFMELAVKAMAHCLKARLTDPSFSAGETNTAAQVSSTPVPAEPLVMATTPPDPVLQSVYAGEAPAASPAAEHKPSPPLPSGPPTEPWPVSTEPKAAPAGPASFGIITFDDHWRIESINPAAATMFGYAPVELAGMSVETLIPAGLPASVQNFAPGSASEKGKESKDCWIVGRRKDGAQFPANLMLKEIVVGKYHRVTGILRSLDQMIGTGQRQVTYDQGRLQRVEAQLAEARVELEKAVAARQESEQRLSEALTTKPIPAPSLPRPDAKQDGVPSPTEEELRHQIESLNSEMAQMKSAWEQEVTRRAQAEQLARDFSEVAADFEKRLESSPAAGSAAAQSGRTGNAGLAEQELTKVRSDLNQEVVRRQHLERQVSLLAEANKKLQQQFTQPQENAAAMQQAREELAARIQSITAELVQARAELQKESAQRQQVSGEATRLLAANASLRDQAEQLRQSSRQTAELDQKCQSLTEEAARLRTELEQKQTRQQQLEAQLADLSARHAVLSQQLLQQESTASTLVDQREELERRHRRAQAELQEAVAAGHNQAALAQQAEKAAQEVAAVKSQLAQETARREQFEKELAEISTRANGLAEEIAQSRQAEAELRQQGASLQSRLAESAAALAQAEKQLREAAADREQLTAARARVAALEQEQAGLTDRLATLDQELAQSRQAEASLRQQSESMQAHLSEHSTALAQAENQLRDAAAERARFATLKLEQESLAARLAALNQELTQSRQAETELRQECETIQKRLEENSTLQVQTEHQLREATVERDQLAATRARASALEQELSRRREGEARLQKSNQELQTRCEDLNRSLSKAAAELQEAQAESQRASLQQKSIAELRRQRDEWEHLFLQAQQALEDAGTRLKQETAQREMLEQALKSIREQLQAIVRADSNDLGRLAANLQQASARYDEAAAALTQAQEDIRQAARRSTELADDFQTKLANPLQTVIASLNALNQNPTAPAPARPPANVIQVSPSQSASRDDRGGDEQISARPGE